MIARASSGSSSRISSVEPLMSAKSAVTVLRSPSPATASCCSVAILTDEVCGKNGRALRRELRAATAAKLLAGFVRCTAAGTLGRAALSQPTTTPQSADGVAKPFIVEHAITTEAGFWRVRGAALWTAGTERNTASNAELLTRGILEVAA